MAPALTQDTHQPELLIPPYLSTPPYTPSPPTSYITAALSSAAPPALSCNNMEHGPWGAKNSSQQHTPLSAGKDVAKLESHHRSSSTAAAALSHPTPPHSTDSSAPLSPLENKGGGPGHPHYPLQNREAPSPLDHNSSVLSSLPQSAGPKPSQDPGFLHQSNVAPKPEFATSSQESLSMGCCSVDSFRPREGEQCSAPQPNDTPPPLQWQAERPNNVSSYKFANNTLPSLAALTGEGCNSNDILPPALANEVLDMMSNISPTLLDEFNDSVNSASGGEVAVQPPQPQQPAVILPQYSQSQGLSTKDHVESLSLVLSARQAEIQRRGDLLLKRIRRFNAHVVSGAVSSELRTLVAKAPKVMGTDRNITSHVLRSSIPNELDKLLPKSTRDDLVSVSGQLRAAVMMSVQMDPDATDSSSGGESCDELDRGFRNENTSCSVPM